MTYDIENLMQTLKGLLTSNLNAKIDAIEAEKVAGGFPATGLAHISSYHEQNWSDSILQDSPAIFFGVEEIAAQGVGPSTSEKYKCFFEVVLLDHGLDTLAKNRIYRYSRAIKEVFQDNFSAVPGTIKIETVRPISFKLDLNSSEEIKVGGVSLTATLA